MKGSQTQGRYILLLLSFFLVLSVEGQQTDSIKKVKLNFAEYIRFNADIDPEGQFLVGRVHFIHKDIHMYCDSAVLYDEKNTLKAYGSVHIVRGDSLDIYSDRLHYYGNTGLAELRERVLMTDKKSVLTTDSLNYHRGLDVGYYFAGGKLVDSVNVLTSSSGHFYPARKEAFFSKNVKLNNPRFDLFSDTLIYYTSTEVAYIRGASDIFTDSAHIYSEDGFYDTRAFYSQLNKNSRIITGSRWIYADTIKHAEKIGHIHAHNNIRVIDTAQLNEIQGHLGFVDERNSLVWVTDSALLIEYSRPDTFYIHADTLYTRPDSIYNLAVANGNARFFSQDIQGRCDSMVLSSRDSNTYLYHAPVLWVQGYQLTGERIDLIVEEGVVKRLEMHDNALVVWKVLGDRYSQLKGNFIVGHLGDTTLRQVDVDGSVQSMYMVLDEKGMLVGENLLESSFMKVNFKQGAVDRIAVWPSSNGTLYPPLGTPEEERFLRGFRWLDYLRPRNKKDLFLDIVERKE